MLAVGIPVLPQISNMPRTPRLNRTEQDKLDMKAEAEYQAGQKHKADRDKMIKSKTVTEKFKLSVPESLAKVAKKK